MDDSSVFGPAAGIIFALGLGAGMLFMDCKRGETIEKQRQYCLSQCEKLTKDKSDFIECSYGCKEAAEHTKLGEQNGHSNR